MLLYAYLFFLLGRVELWLLFWIAIVAAACIRLAPDTRRERDCAVLTLGVGATVLLMWWLPFARTHLDARRNTLVARVVPAAGAITPDDIQLAAWIESHLPAEKGPVGLASLPSTFGSTKLLFPIGAAQALPLYGHAYNFTFQLFDPSREYSYDEYLDHVSSYFDAEWCLEHNVRYFHLPAGNLHPNHGLARAREVGLLVPIRTVASSALYEVRPLPWKPRVMPLSAMPASTYQITWKADGTAVADGSDAQLVYALDQPQFVHAVRFKYTITHATSQPAEAQLFWSGPGQSFVEHERTAHVRLQPAAREKTVTILVHDTVDQFRFDPDERPFTLHIRDMELLVKPPDQP
ncbi:MAG: hypothetical protein H0V80_01050 [Acidobacteria bacterium]|nr:hypothetical protein [Acidobacteriota bacterium]